MSLTTENTENTEGALNKKYASLVLRVKQEIKKPTHNDYPNLSKRKPEEWEEQISKLDEVELRKRVACIVWWDFFGGRLASDRWPHLDKWINAKYEAVSDEVVMVGLYLVGYQPKKAKSRSGVVFKKEESK